ncbi:MAG: ArsR/SmtB family transcription factor [Solirubrobacteraceae bacterium]
MSVRREIEVEATPEEVFEALATEEGRDPVGPVFAALADPTRRLMVEELLRDGTTSVPALSAVLPITRQAVAKHLAALDHAGLVERAPASGREVRYRLRAGALTPATEWLAGAEAAWEQRLARLKSAVESGPSR